MDAIEGKVVNREVDGKDEKPILDLDVWLNEAADEDEGIPFTFTVGGVLYTLLSPEDFDWQENSRASASTNQADMRPLLQLLLGEEQYEEFCKHKLPNKAINKIIGDWNDHHDISVPESRASRRASERTAKKQRPTSKRRTK
ncbi:hypothetical protein [Embleya sp. NPDC001921]